MNKILVLIIIIIPFLSSVFPQDNSFAIKRNTKTLNDSILTAGKVTKTDTSAEKDRIQIVQDSLKTTQPKPLNPIMEKGLLSRYDFGTILGRNQLLFIDYRFTGDFINLSSKGFIRDFGMLGQPDEVLIYGAGFNNISYLQDGMLLNNRFSNSLDLNFLQSESIDSIEIIPTVRGFLYGTIMNPVSVNFISKNNLVIDGKTGSYSRLRYYQASNEEAFIDAIYRTNITKRLFGIFEMTNESIADRFMNSNYDSWKANVKLNYILSDNFNLVGDYNYLKSEVHLFGGINLDSLSIMTLPPSTELEFPIINYSRYEKNTDHNFYIKLVNSISPELSGELSTYYRFNLLEYRQNEYGTLAHESIISRNHITKVLGSVFREIFEDSLYSADLITNYEKVFIKSDSSFKENQASTSSISGKLSFKLAGNKFIPSLFGKYLYFNDKSFYGFGGDVTYHFSPYLSFYAGASYFQKPLFIPGTNINIDYEKITNLEAGVKINSKYIALAIDIFHRKINNNFLMIVDQIENTIAPLTLTNNLLGTNINLTINIWRIYLESKSSFFYNKFKRDNFSTRVYLLPEFIFKGGIYYRDTLFNSNLHLKTGISFTSISSQDLYSYDFETNSFIIGFPVLNNYQQNNKISPSNNFNFDLIGEIQDRAIIYFTFENLFDKQYYIVPYYLKQRRGIRLGVSWEFLN